MVRFIIRRGLPNTHSPMSPALQTAKKRQKEPTTDENNDLEWAGTISIGTPAQNFLIDFDSKSTTYYWLQDDG